MRERGGASGSASRGGRCDVLFWICAGAAAARVHQRAGVGPRENLRMFFKTAFLVLRKDLAIEIKSFELLSTTLFFGVGCVLIFAFALVKEGQAPPDAAAAILWIALLFAG